MRMLIALFILNLSLGLFMLGWSIAGYGWWFSWAASAWFLLNAVLKWGEYRNERQWLRDEMLRRLERYPVHEPGGVAVREFVERWMS